MRKIIYAALFLSEETKAQLLKLIPAKHPVVYAHHLTLAFRPTQAEVDAFLPDLGKEFEFLIGHALSDEKGQCIDCWAQSGPVENLEGAHVTISCAEGVAPVYSRRLVAPDMEDLADIDLDDDHIGVPIRGRLGFFTGDEIVYSLD